MTTNQPFISTPSTTPPHPMQSVSLADITQHIPQGNPLLKKFIQAYYQTIPQPTSQSSDELNTGKALAEIAINHFGLLQRYQLGVPQVAVFNPDTTDTSDSEQHDIASAHNSYSVIQMVAADRPFLVDTLLMCLESLNITVYRVHNTIMAVSRDSDNQISNVSTTTTSDTKFISLIYCEIARQTDAMLQQVQAAILDKIKVLDIVVGDWQAMRQQLVAVKSQLAASPLPMGTQLAEQSGNLDEIAAFLDWILDDNFIFLGYGEYHYAHEADEIEIQYQPNSGLGLIAHATHNTNNKGDALSSDKVNQLPNTLRAMVNTPQILLLSKSSDLSPVHRPVYMDFVGIQRFDEAGKVVGEHRFIGLLTANAYQLAVNQIPMLRQKANNVMTRARLPANGHAYYKFLHILNSLPRDDLFQATTEELYTTVAGIANLHNRHQLRLFARIDHYQRFVSCLVFIPREKFNTQLRIAVQEALIAAFGGISAQFSVEFDELYHTRLHIQVLTQPAALNIIDLNAILPQLEAQLAALMQSWQDNVKQVCFDTLDEQTAERLTAKYLADIPLAYQEDFSAETALQDMARLEALETRSRLNNQAAGQISWSLYQDKDESQQDLHLKIYGNHTPATLSRILPILENFGLEVIGSQSYEFGVSQLWLQAYHLRLRQPSQLNMAVVATQVEDALDLIWQGAIENDGLNELVLVTPLDAHEVAVLRALSHYMLQAKAPFSLSYIKQTLVKYPQLSVLFVQLFHTKMQPLDAKNDSCVMQGNTDTATLNAQIQTALKSVQTLDEDKILRWLVDLLNALLRTNYYQREPDGQRKNRLSFKFSANDIANLPKPKPLYEIFVYSPQVEAVHLRGGKVARGGLRWSDRKEDFRTEVLGLVKAQMVKNSVIVPVGSKGGFIVKTKTMQAGRDAYMAEGVACYQTFIRGMLDITDNLVDARIVPPAHTVRHDGDDPYLVVAADKGTASFSDIANAISQEYGFWLGDAFASGGSVGYDHKAMGITARGAWESVKRHFRLLGKDIQNPAGTRNRISVVGIGDMSGDVFGNGMLLSPNIQLVAAFNHLHIFIDPNPDVTASFAERERLFALPRSTWADYDQSLISQGGGVFSRQDKAITVTPAMKATFGLTLDTLTPDELIHALLMSPVDLIWNGGIGTYVKSAQETNLDVGDRANDAVRINGNEVRAKVIGEGGNLGMTQQGRIEYAKQGGKVYTDAIDNSAGVNCSDHEVNIKILLDKVVSQGQLSMPARNDLLASMTDTVASLVLRQNYLQPQAIELSARQALDNLPIQQKFMQFLENQERLDRAIEFLPNDAQLSVRQNEGQGLTHPELAVLLAYGKMWVYDNLLASDVPDNDYYLPEIQAYFPAVLSDAYAQQMHSHPLYREIISTYMTNSVVNRLGIEGVYRIVDALGVSVASVVKAYTVVRDVFNLHQYWELIESLDNQIDAQVQLEMELRLRQDITQSIDWVLQQFGEDIALNTVATTLSQGVQTLMTQAMTNQPRTSYFVDYLDEVKLAYPQVAALQSLGINLSLSPQILDAIWFANKTQQTVSQVAQVYFKAYELLHIDWLLTQVERLPQDSFWERRAAHALREDIMMTFRRYMSQFLADSQPMQAIDAFAKTQAANLDELEQAKAANDEMNLAILSVLVSQLKAD